MSKHKLYICQICNTTPDQISHHKQQQLLLVLPSQGDYDWRNNSHLIHDA